MSPESVNPDPGNETSLGKGPIPPKMEGSGKPCSPPSTKGLNRKNFSYWKIQLEPGETVRTEGENCDAIVLGTQHWFPPVPLIFEVTNNCYTVITS